jgi:hypothetical protein
MDLTLTKDAEVQLYLKGRNFLIIHELLQQCRAQISQFCGKSECEKDISKLVLEILTKERKKCNEAQLNALQEIRMIRNKYSHLTSITVPFKTYMNDSRCLIECLDCFEGRQNETTTRIEHFTDIGEIFFWGVNYDTDQWWEYEYMYHIDFTSDVTCCLWHAAKEGNVLEVLYYLKEGGDPEGSFDGGCDYPISVLDCAISSGNLECLFIILFEIKKKEDDSLDKDVCWNDFLRALPLHEIEYEKARKELLCIDSEGNVFGSVISFEGYA